MKKRLDILLFEKRLYDSREKAKQAIEMGRVKVSGVIVKKASFLCDEEENFDTKPFEFVSRGGFKLQKAIEDFKVDLKDKVVMDIGASTGGFSDVCIQNGAKKIYCIDTGEGQLVDKIKMNPIVINYEKTNFLNLEKEKIADVNFVVIDVSFTSLTNLSKKLAEDFEHIEIIALIKPQFECGIDYARKHKGVVKDSKVHNKIIEKIKDDFSFYGFENKGVVESPIKGGDGNTEFLIYLKK